MRDLEELLARVRRDGQVDEALQAEFAALDADALASALDQVGPVVACELAALLARRHDPRGVAALARATTSLLTAARALRHLDALDMLDMVPPALLTADRREQADAVELLGAEPESLESVWHGEATWPGEEGHELVALYRYRLERAAGLVLVRPVGMRIDGGARLDADDALSLACGAAYPDRATPVPLEDVSRERLSVVVKGRAYRMLAEVRLVAAHRVGDELVLTVDGYSRGRRGHLVGGAAGRLPTHWIEADLTAEQAFGLWLGRLLRAGAV